MKKTRSIAFLLVFCFILFTMVGCVPKWTQKRNPIYYRGSIWESEDGRVQFKIDLVTKKHFFGTVERDGRPVEMIFASGYSWYGMAGCSVEDYEAIEPDELGYKYITTSVVQQTDSYEDYDFVELHAQEHYFEAEIIDSAIYEKGERVTFYRIDGTKDITVEKFELADYKKQEKEHASDQKLENSEEDLEKAVSLARFALEQEFGSLSDQLEVFYDSRESCWLIKGTHSFELFFKVPHILFRTDGTILAMWEE